MFGVGGVVGVFVLVFRFVFVDPLSLLFLYSFCPCKLLCSRNTVCTATLVVEVKILVHRQ